MPKRRKSSSSSMRGTFTRSRSEIFLHRTRSGLARPDRYLQPKRLTRIAPTTGPMPPLDVNLNTVKDLRLRRVFSDRTAKIKSTDDTMDEKDGTGEKRSGGDVEFLKGSDDSGGDLGQGTPPDSDLVGKFDEEESGGDRMDLTVKISEPESSSLSNNRMGTPPDGDLVSELDQADSGSERRMLKIPEPDSSSPSKNRMGLVPCSRSKLFRNPSSFNYRRLLPYLMDVANESSKISLVPEKKFFLVGGMEILDSNNYTMKAEKSMEERPSPLNVDPLSKQQHHTVPLGDSPSANSREKQDLEEIPVSEKPVLNFQDVHNPITAESPNSFNESKLQVQVVTSEIPLESSNFEFEMCKSSYCTPTIREDLSVQELAGDVRTLSHLPRKSEEGCSRAALTLEMDGRPLLGVSQIGALSHVGNQALAPRKGILKRQARGCRGICMCLDCASFRVHAERAYEFSRKQMLEADEVVEGLMKELSYLRSLVERSVVPMVEGTGRYTVLQLNQEQVKGVCQRAVRVEELAKNRTRQMIRDLNIHCRIPGPRVTFTDCVEERIIP